jgi:hypothetical protein
MKVGQMPRPQLRVRRVNLDTSRQNVAMISRRSRALCPEVFHGFSRIQLKTGDKSMLATLFITNHDSTCLRRARLASPSTATTNQSSQPLSRDSCCFHALI